MPRTATVLIVDDDRDTRETLRDAVEDAGYVVVEARAGHAALQYLQSERGAASVVLLDLHMPDFGGKNVVEALRSDARLSGLPVVIMSGERPTAEASTNVFAYLEKPVRLEKVLGAIEVALGLPAKIA